MTSAADRIRSFVAGIRKLSALGVILANLVPLACIILFGWPAGILLILYWVENVVIGLFNVVKMLSCGVAWGRVGLLSCLFAVPFFVFHYGLFCFGHGVFVMLITSLGQPDFPTPVVSIVGLHDRVRELVHNEPGFAWSLLAMTGLQLFTFLFDWLPRGKARKLNPIIQMFAPYGRIVVLHITLIAGVLLVAALGQPIWAIVVLAVVKTLFDLGALGFHLEDAVRDDKTNQAFAEAEAALKMKLAAKS